MKRTILIICIAVVGLLKPISASASPEYKGDGYIFDAEFYASEYPEITEVIGSEPNILFEHYRNSGWKEGRYPYAPGTTMTTFEGGFDAAEYAAANPDVVEVYGTMPFMLYLHYTRNGINENRKINRDVERAKPFITRDEYPEAAMVLDQVGWDLQSAYRWSVGLTYYGHGKPDMPETGDPGTKWFAEFGFRNHKGNCFVFAATFNEMAKLLGYSPRQIYGGVTRRDGTIGPHSWDEFDIDGVTYVFDPEFEYATGKSGWQFVYGKKGTWRYVNNSLMKE